jgi:4-amino-4-deoxy-L-arabinose transferase-like glycosyltransferase
MADQRILVERGILALIVLAYIALGILYAVTTPLWQVPDEPAHYNYVRYLVEEKRFPVLQMGDYDQAYLHEITTQQFAPALSIDPIRYEYHQPPLYYVLAVPLYAAFGGALLPLRLLSVGFGAALLVVAYLVGKAMYPDRAWPALGTAAFIAFIPQHIAMTAGVENDTLAELILGLVLLRLIRWLRADAPGSTWQLIGTGALMGLALLTKSGVYIVLPLALIAVGLKFFRLVPSDTGKSSRYQLNARPALRAAAALLLPALLLGLPWFIRNALVYGGLDILGLGQHGRVVVGQPRTAEWIAEHGWVKLSGIFSSTTFHSFWAQFGWMAVPIDARIYAALRLLTILVLLGLVFRFADAWEARQRPSSAALLLTSSGLLTLATYLGYNLTFYQAQGRYLFPALIPLGIGWSFGLREILRRKNARIIAIVLALVTMLGAIRWLTRTGSSKWQILTNGSGALYLGLRWVLPEKAINWFFALPFLGMAALCAVSPFWFIVPYLAP